MTSMERELMMKLQNAKDEKERDLDEFDPDKISVDSDDDSSADEAEKPPKSQNGNKNGHSNGHGDGHRELKKSPEENGHAGGESNRAVDAPVASGVDIWKEIRSLYTDIDKSEYKVDATVAMEVGPCSCKYDPETDPRSHACGADAHCINRELMWECNPDECPCGHYCLNRRQVFSKREYADIEVIRTEKKGYGLRTKVPLRKNTFVIEYLGEVVSAGAFMKRSKEYAEQGSKHFYFMSLKSDVFIDAQNRGNIARFVNHSCDPNCEVQKWMVGNHHRMGIFTKRELKAGEELTFDYKFERYGGEPQKCFCGEAKCKGVIGGQKSGDKVMYVEEDDDDMDYEEKVLRPDKPRRNSSKGDDDDEEEYVVKKVPKGLDSVEAVQKFVKAMLNLNTNPSRIQRLLKKLELTTEVNMQRKFLQYHGLSVLKCALAYYVNVKKDYPHITYEIIRLLKVLPISSRNSIQDCKIEEVVSKLVDFPNYQTAQTSKDLLETWKELPMIYKIPKRVASEVAVSPGGKKRSPDAAEESIEKKRSRFDDYDDRPSPKQQTATNGFDLGKANDAAVFYPRSRKSIDEHNNKWGKNSPRGVDSNIVPGRNVPLTVADFDVETQTLPKHWKATKTEDGKIYFYNTITRATQWELPKEAPPSVDDVRKLSSTVEGVSDAAIEAIVRQANASGTPGSTASNEANMKLLRNGISTIVVKTLSKYKSEISSERFKKLARKITHQVMAKEGKNGAVVPSKVSDEMKAKIKKFTKTQLEKGGVKIEKGKKSKKKKKGHHHAGNA
ncbi:histone methyltransferase set2 [Irineochytrium annulatum]|nr:histone methyltransferase set2 [Irineochytrium annulatum]